MEYIERFGKYFQSYRRDVTPQAKQYLQGLMQAGRNKNMERMADVVPDSAYQNLQHFVTNSKWSHRAVMDEVAMTANEHIGDAENGMLLIDETGFPKQGKMSAGVSRQWIGNIGKTDNGQVAVCAALNRENLVTPVDIQLFLSIGALIVGHINTSGKLDKPFIKFPGEFLVADIILDLPQ